MSQTSRSRIIAAQRHRRGLARVIAQDQAMTLAPGAVAPGHELRIAPGLALSIVSGNLRFDVHRAREYAEELKALEVEQAVFEDWTRARGKGPESREPGAFMRDEHRTYGGPIGDGLVGRGWHDDGERDDGRTYWLASRPGVGGWPGKLAREWPGDRRAPMGRSLARLGRRLLEALEGQPSECQACDEDCDVVTHDGDEVCDCRDCRGTGHNLAGVLPPIEVTPGHSLDTLPRESVLRQPRKRTWPS